MEMEQRDASLVVRSLSSQREALALSCDVGAEGDGL